MPRQLPSAPGIYESVPWLLMLLALVNMGWALWVASAPPPDISADTGNIRLLHELSPDEFVALQAGTGVESEDIVEPQCDLYGPIPGGDVPAKVRQRVAVGVAGVGLVPEWQLNPGAYWLVAGPFEDAGARAAARHALEAQGIGLFVPAQPYWQNLLVLATAADVDGIQRARQAMQGEVAGLNVLRSGEMNLHWWLRIMHWEGADPGAEIGASAVYSDGSALTKKSCKSIAKPIEFD